MSIQYTVLEFNPTTFGTRVSSHNHLTIFDDVVRMKAIEGSFSPKASNIPPAFISAVVGPLINIDVPIKARVSFSDVVISREISEIDKSSLDVHLS